MLIQSGNPAEAIISFRQADTVKLGKDKLDKELPQQTPHRQSVRSSLKFSTFDGIFATIFINITSGVLLSNFLVDLDASTMVIGVLAAIPMVVNLLQPLGAYLADRTTSRHWYGLWVYGPSRLVWLVLALGILLFTWQQTNLHLLVYLTSGVVLVSAILTALGSASWLSWKAALVPRQLRGRYFGFRNSTVSLATLICVPVVGLGVSTWPGGTVQGYGVMLLLAVVAGMISLLLQFFMIDVNPRLQRLSPTDLYHKILRRQSSNKTEAPARVASLMAEPTQSEQLESGIWQDTNFLIFLLYFGFWTFAVNLSAPFFNIYLLDNLNLDVKWVTLYSSLQAAANLLLLMLWGKLSDRIGNRPLLLLMGVLVAITPLLWLGVNTTPVSLWVWLPFLHILAGGTWAAIDLCSNNIQMAIAPMQRHSTYFAIAAAVAGGSGALGTVIGGFLAEFVDYGGLLGMFALSGGLRLIALLPLMFVREHRGQPVIQLVRTLGAGMRPR